jgi:hypothetical protein
MGRDLVQLELHAGISKTVKQMFLHLPKLRTADVEKMGGYFAFKVSVFTNSN